jgi:protein-tyrosine phosphatase
VKTILFVCTANICRSPMAAAIMRRRVAELGFDGEIEVLSAGVYAEPGYPASRLAVSTLAQRDIPLDEHRSQPVVPALLRDADVVLVMEEAHRRSIFYLAPQYLGKVYLLSELAGRHDDVADPYGRSSEAYERTAMLLEGLIDTGLPKLLKQLNVGQQGAGLRQAALS